jgi:hypothetical protein
MVELSIRVDGTLKSRVIATYVGMALYTLFAILSSFAGSSVAYDQGQSTLKGIGIDSRRRRMATFNRRLSSRVDRMFDSPTAPTVPKISFLATQALAWIGAAITLGGVASMQSYCFSNPQYFSETRLPWYTYLSTSENDFKCSSAFAEKWWAWALSVVTLLFLALAWQNTSLAKFKAATWALLISSATFNFTWINNLIDWSHDTQGTFHDRVVVTIAGFIIYDIGALLSLFTGSVYLYRSYSTGQTSKIVRDGASSSTTSTTAAAGKAKTVFIVLQVFAWISQIICLVGLAWCQSYLDAPSPPTDGTMPILSTFKGFNSKMYTAFSSNLRFAWTVWALQLVVIISMVAFWNTRALRKYKSAVWLLMISVATLNMTVCSHFFRQMEVYNDSYKTRVRVTFAGYCLWDFFMYLAMFAGSAHAWEQRQTSEKTGDEEENKKVTTTAAIVEAETCLVTETVSSY